MTEKKADVSEFTDEVLIADLLIRLSVVETMLVMKGVCTEVELKALNRLFSENITKNILQKAGTSDNLKEFIFALEGEKS